MGMGWMFRQLCTWEVGDTCGMVTDDSETFRLDNLESEVVVGACEHLIFVILLDGF
jgi:hypothetical protein